MQYHSGCFLLGALAPEVDQYHVYGGAGSNDELRRGVIVTQPASQPDYNPNRELIAFCALLAPPLGGWRRRLRRGFLEPCLPAC